MFVLMFVITALNMLHRLLEVKDKPPLSFSILFSQRLSLSQHTAPMFVTVIHFRGSWDYETINLSSKCESIRKIYSPEVCKFLLCLISDCLIVRAVRLIKSDVDLHKKESKKN